MLTDLYVYGSSPLHRCKPSIKIGALTVFCTLVFIYNSWITILVASAMVVAGFLVAGLELRHAIISVRPAFWILAAIFIVQMVMADISLAALIILRFMLLILAASLVTLTTKPSEFVDGIMAGLHFAPSWVPKENIALAISLCLRFIPLVRTVLNEVRDAQKARGMDRNFKALLVPLIVRTLKSADEVSQAIYARSLD